MSGVCQFKSFSAVPNGERGASTTVLHPASQSISSSWLPKQYLPPSFLPCCTFAKIFLGEVVGEDGEGGGEGGGSTALCFP